jgi:ATP phosphoribosyltransferase regulatory subunit
MIRPIPSGTRDVLPDEMRELRAISEPMRVTFARFGYGEVYTPALEYESTLAAAVQAGLDPAAPGARPAYRLFDENGEVLVLRSDMTVPIARVAATRYAGSQPPLRFCYLAHAYRGVGPQRGQPREVLQAGIELIGAPAPQGTAEALTVLCAALEAAGLDSYRVGMGDAGLYPALLDSLGVADAARPGLMQALVRRDFVALEHRIDELALDAEAAALLVEVPQRRGGDEILGAPDGAVTEAVGRIARVRDLLEPAVGERIIFDLGLARGLGYYTGAVFEVYDPALGAPLGGGGRYDDLLARFGRPLPAVGFAINVERLHLAITGEERYR